MQEFAEFLFPRDLELTSSGIRNILVVGSCLAESYTKDFLFRDSALSLDYILFNNAHELPEQPPQPLASYDFQFVQIPLRSVLSDRIIRYGDFCGDLHEDLRDAAFRSLDAMLEAGLRYGREAGLLTIVSTFVVPQRAVTPAMSRHNNRGSVTALVRELNDVIAEACNRIPNVYVADTDEIAASYGKGLFLDDWWHIHAHNATMPHNWEEGTEAPYHLNTAIPRADSLHPIREHGFYQLVWRQLESIYRSVRQIDQVKLVIFDLDNTLWRGRIADHYADGLDWPTADGWVEGLNEAIHHLRARGILVAICSRNDEPVVAARWERAQPRALLSLDDFVLRRINYGSKADNVADIMADAGLTAKSVVFVDDNPVERDEVKARFPQMRVIGDNQFHTRRILLWAPETQVPFVSDETARREHMIKQQVVRETTRSTMPRDEFLRNLKCEVDIFEIDGAEHAAFGRVLELINKTNQFNTTGERWSSAGLIAFLREGGRIFAFRVRDKFVDYGLVGLILEKNRIFTQYVLSCRVLGMEVETSALHWVMSQVSAPSTRFSGRIVDTGVNMVSRDIFSRSGFGEVESGRFEYVSNGRPEIASHLTLRGTTSKVGTRPSPPFVTGAPGDVAADQTLALLDR